MHPLGNGFPKAKFKGLKTLDEARKHIKKEGITSHELRLNDGHGATKPARPGPAYFAVANGRDPGIRKYHW